MTWRITSIVGLLILVGTVGLLVRYWITGSLFGQTIKCRWYTTKTLRGDALNPGISLTDKAKKQKLTFLVVTTSIPQNKLRNDKGASVQIRPEYFKLHCANGSTFTAEGFDTGFGFSMGVSVTINYSSTPKDHMKLGIVFVVETPLVDRGKLKFQFKDLEPVELSRENRD